MGRVFDIATLESSRVAAPEASVSYVAQAVEPLTGAATVRFAFQRPPSGVLVGMPLDFNVSVTTVLRAVTIQRESVGGSGAHAFVLVVSGGSVERRGRARRSRSARTTSGARVVVTVSRRWHDRLGALLMGERAYREHAPAEGRC